MVACTQCVESGAVCYYDRDQSSKCAECLRKQRSCDGTFALEEFRKVGELKKQIREKARLKQREMQLLRRRLLEAQQALADVELENVNLEDEVARLEEVSSRMLRREMQALGVLETQPQSEQVVMGDPNWAWSEAPVTDLVDWEAVLGVFSAVPSSVAEASSATVGSGDGVFASRLS